MNRYRMALGADGVLHIQAFFEGNDDLNFKWRTGFVFFKDRERSLRWGIWDTSRVLISSEPKDALPFINALLKHRHYIADTVLPKVIPGDTPDSYMSVLPSEAHEEVRLSEADIYTLGEQRDILLDWVSGNPEDEALEGRAP